MSAHHRGRRIHRLPVGEDVDREIRLHLELRAQELMALGWSEADARAEAERLFGDRARIAAASREQAERGRRRKDRASMMETWWRDVRFGARSLAKNRGFTIAALVTLTLGIGANTAIFSVVNGVLLRRLPYPSPDRLVVLWERAKSGSENHVARPNFEDWRAQSRSFDALALTPGDEGWGVTVLGAGEAVQARVSMVGGAFFRIMGKSPVLGRTFSADESRPGGTPVVVVSHAFWSNQLGSTRDLSSVSLRMQGGTYAVIGVMPASFDYPTGTDIWAPAEQLDDGSTRTAHNWGVIGRLRSGVTLAAARSEMNGIAERLQQEYAGDNDAYGVVVKPLQDELTGGARRSLLLLMGAAVFVLLIACGNMAGTLLARGAARAREVAVRAAMGAGRGRIVRQLLTESLLLALGGALLGVAVGWAVLHWLLTLNPAALPAGTKVSLDAGVLLFALVVSVLTALVFGLLPALRLSATEPGAVVRSSRGAAPGVRRGPWPYLIATEVALALVLLVGSGLLIRSFWSVLTLNPGYREAGVLTVNVSLPQSVYGSEPNVSTTLTRLRSQLATLPGVDAVGGITTLPLATSGMNGAMQVEGQSDWDGYAEYRVVLPGYFESMGITLVEGRAFNDHDRFGEGQVAVVNQTLADRYWPGEDPIGKRLRGTTNDRYADWMTIVGVVGNVRHRSLTATPRAELYVDAVQRPARARDMTFTLHTAGDAAALAGPARALLRRAVPDAALTTATMRNIAARSVADRRFTLLVLGAFAAVALLLAGAGIYGVVGYTVARRTREIGVRLALGAEPSRVLRMVQGGMLVPAGVGAVMGLGAAFGLTRLLSGLLYGVAPLDPMTFAAVSILVLAAAWLASYVPARRAAAVDPVRAMHEE
ncbi:MAG: ABC transporter permease [Gemmatimonadota bacterium]